VLTNSSSLEDLLNPSNVRFSNMSNNVNYTAEQLIAMMEQNPCFNYTFDMSSVSYTPDVGKSMFYNGHEIKRYRHANADSINPISTSCSHKSGFSPLLLVLDILDIPFIDGIATVGEHKFTISDTL
jgi:hypothetical protein